MITWEIVAVFVAACGVILTALVHYSKGTKENTKALTECTAAIKYLTKKIAENEQDLSKYKEKVSDGQKRQWEAIDENSEKIADHEKRIHILEERK